jgi:hypothetical protein
MSLFALLLCVAGFASFGLATDQHHRLRFGRTAPAAIKRQMRRGAWAAIALAFPISVAARGWVVGPILWSAWAMLGAGIAFLALNLLPAKGPFKIAKGD